MPPSPNPTPTQIWSLLRSSHSSPLPLETLLSRSIPSPTPSLVLSVLASADPTSPSDRLLSLRLFLWSALLPRSPRPSPSSFSLASSLLLLPSDPLLLHRLLDSPSLPPPTAKTFSLLLRLSPLFPLSLSLLRRMPSFSLSPDLPSFNSLLRLAPSPAIAAQIFHELSLALRPDLASFSALLFSFASARLLAPALSLLPLMRASSVPPSLPTYTSLLSLACSLRDLPAARRILDEMHARSLPPNVVSYTCLIKCLCRLRSPASALPVLAAMLKHGSPPNRVTLRTLIQSFCDAGMLDHAYAFAAAFSTPESYSILASSLLRTGDRGAAAGLLRRMLEAGAMPDGWTRNSFLRHLCERRMFVEAYKWVGELEKVSCCVDSDVYSSLLEGLCEEGRSAEALEVARRVVECEIPVGNSCADAVVSLLEGIGGEGDLASRILRLKAEESLFPSHT